MKATLYYVCKIDDGTWKRYPAVIGKNNRIRPRFAKVGDSQKFYEVGHYEIRVVDAGKTKWENVGEEAAEAFAKFTLKTKRLAAQEAAEEAGTELKETGDRIRLAPIALKGDKSAAVENGKAAEFYNRQIALGRADAARIFMSVFNGFMETARVSYADEVKEKTILDWYVALRKEGNSERTIANKHISLMSMFRWLGVHSKEKPIIAAIPKYTEPDVEVYTDEELREFFAQEMTPYYRLLFKTLLKTGLRKEEAQTLEWRDINFSRGTLTVTKKDDLGFDIKDRAGRTLPLVPDLAEELKAWKEDRGGRFVFGVGKDFGEIVGVSTWLECLKRIAKRAGLNCGYCKGCKRLTGRNGHASEAGFCDHWYLHKFRSTYTTKMLRQIPDPRTVMSFTGHADLKTIMRYLAPATVKSVQEQVSAIAWGD